MSAPFDWASLAAEAARGALPLVHFGCAPINVAMAARQPVYLASPYSRRAVDAGGQWDRTASMRAILDAAAELRRLKAVGVTAVSPVVLSGMAVHELPPDGPDFEAHHPLDAAAWMGWCQPLLNAAPAMVVPEIAGWDVSDGVKAEVAFAVRHQMQVFIYARVAPIVL